MQFAPRISRRVRDEIERLADRPLSSAEITRIVGTMAEERGFRRPSYQRVRSIVAELRRRPRGESTASFLINAVYRPGLFYRNFGSSTPFGPK
jgi:hypothetical protein